MAARSGVVACVLAAALASATEASSGEVSREPGPDAGAWQERLFALLLAGRHPDLAWSDFSEDRDAVLRFYAAGDYGLAWFQGAEPSPQARALVHALEHADEVGLDPRDYDGPRWRARLAAPSLRCAPLERGRLDAGLTVSAVRYASDLAAGRLRNDPAAERMGRARVATPDDGDVAAFLRRRVVEAKDAEDVADALASAGPRFEAYRRTVEAVRRYLALAARDEAEARGAPPDALAGGAPRWSDRARLATRLRLVGDLGDEPAPREGVSEDALATALARFQRRHGLEPTGALDGATVRALDVPLRRRAEQLALALERWRWLPRRFTAPPLVVNVPEFRLHVAERGRRWSMKVVVGRSYWRTPLFAAELTHVVFRPHWNVPLRIQRDELVPGLAQDPGRLVAGDYELLDPEGAVVAGAATPEVLERLRAGTLRLRQRPGPRNALGLVQFVVPNPYGVYLHDTPAPELFARSRRDFSHGCIRVEEPVALAAWALRGDPTWTPERIRAAMAGPETLEVDVVPPVPVLVLYGTAVVAEDGAIQFLDDVYGGDEALDRALARERARRAGGPGGSRPSPTRASSRGASASAATLRPDPPSPERWDDPAERRGGRRPSPAPGILPACGPAARTSGDTPPS